MNKSTKLYSFSFVVKKIKFNPNATLSGKLTVNINFVRYHEQTVFEPIVQPPTNIVNLNAGKTFTFGLDRCSAIQLSKDFIIRVSLHQNDPDKQLSEAVINGTKTFRDVLMDVCPRKSKTQLKTTIKFNDVTGNEIAEMDVVVLLSPAGPTIVNEFNLDGNIDQQHIAMTSERACPVVPEFKIPTKEHDNEWVVIGAELNSGQKITIKYKKSCYELKSGIDKTNEPCEEIKVKTTKSEEKLNYQMLGLMEEMHKIIAANTTMP
ncbi:Hypothetical protein CINCED_3A023466 [Cinara cedri]|uniref:Uncharacterized protein n=1 Tax=Cinara cedri TaxID=506608 RepID=A0A5E4MPQ2_9HEMI|nr:Hypothetical protein CINCED_3A023466 [Cinara cedri]